jgi:hypothetical protein
MNVPAAIAVVVAITGGLWLARELERRERNETRRMRGLS